VIFVSPTGKVFSAKRTAIRFFTGVGLLCPPVIHPRITSDQVGYIRAVHQEMNHGRRPHQRLTVNAKKIRWFLRRGIQ
jgi:hypothetical protein